MTRLAALVFLLQGGGLPDDFDRLHRELAPARGEAWRTIPWKTGILEARDLAAREKKPVFMWAMVGHPLACT